MRAFFFGLGLILLSAPAVAQAPAQPAPRVHIEHLRGPISARELRRAWSRRRFRRCEAELHADAAHLQVTVDREGQVHADRGRPEEILPPELACVVEVLERTRFRPQTEETEAYVTVLFRPRGAPDPRRAAAPGARGDPRRRL